jgi:hypothetical protein
MIRRLISINILLPGKAMKEIAINGNYLTDNLFLKKTKIQLRLLDVF